MRAKVPSSRETEFDSGENGDTASGAETASGGFMENPLQMGDSPDAESTNGASHGLAALKSFRRAAAMAKHETMFASTLTQHHEDREKLASQHKDGQETTNMVSRLLTFTWEITVVQMQDNVKEHKSKSQELGDAEASCLVFHPDTPLIRSWNTVQALLIMWVFVELPFRIAFRAVDNNQTETGLDLAVDILLALDFVLHFFKAYHYHDYFGRLNLEVSHSKICMHYFNNGFLVDLASCLPWDTLVRLNGDAKLASYVRLLRTCRIARINVLVTKVDTVVDKYSASISWLRPLTSAFYMIFFMLFFNHVMCCLIYWTGHEDTSIICQDTDTCGWVIRTWGPGEEEVAAVSEHTKYVTAFYYSFTILTTVGFGDITAKSNAEKTVNVIAMVAGCAVFGVIMGRIGSIVHAMHMGTAVFDAKMRELEEYMTYRGTGPSLRKRVTDYFKLMYPSSRMFDEKAILSSLPSGLRTEFLLDMYQADLELIPFLPSDRNVLVAVCNAMVPMTFMPGEMITNEGALGREMYMVMHGEVLEMTGSEGLILRRVKKGKLFGEVALFIESRRQVRYIAQEFSNVARLDKDDLDRMRKEYPALQDTVTAYGKTMVDNMKMRLLSQLPAEEARLYESHIKSLELILGGGVESDDDDDMSTTSPDEHARRFLSQSSPRASGTSPPDMTEAGESPTPRTPGINPDFLKLVETEVDENGGNVAATEMQILAQMLAKIYAKMHAIEQRQRRTDRKVDAMRGDLRALVSP